MFREAAGQLGIKDVVLDAKNSPAKQVNARNSHVDGSFMDLDKIMELSRRCDVLTVEVEHMSTDALEDVVSRGVYVMVGGKAVKKFRRMPP
jgi:phosphoribosylaminoimidazole carboxylase